MFITDGLTENDLLDYARTITNKLSENVTVMKQIENNSAEQAMLGDFSGALDDAVMESSEAHQNQMNQILSNKEVAAGFGRIVFDLLVAQMKGMKLGRSSDAPRVVAGALRNSAAQLHPHSPPPRFLPARRLTPQFASE